MIKFKDVDEIEAEIEKLEDEISHSSLSYDFSTASIPTQDERPPPCRNMI